MRLTHIGVISDLSDSDASLWVCIKYFCNKILALWGQELWHLIISGHDLFVKV